MSFLSKGFGALALAALVASPLAAQAQTPRPAAPAQRAPAAPAAPASAAPPPGSATRVDLVPSQTEWTKVCGHDDAANKDVCYTTRDFGQAAGEAPVLALAVYDVKGDDTRIVRLLMPIGLLLPPGFRFSVDKSPMQDGAFQICFPNGCFAESKIKGPTVETMRKGTVMNVSVKNQANAEVTFGLPLAGFGKAFDGAPIDPKVLQAQQEALEKQLQDRIQQQQSGQAAPAAGATPAPAPAAPATPAPAK